MQDSDSAQLVNKLPPKAGLILGVTNPFFERSCVHWPHILSLGRRTSYVYATSAPADLVTNLQSLRTSNSSKKNTPSLGAPAGPAPGWKTRTHKRYISKDRALLKHLEAAIKGDDQARKWGIQFGVLSGTQVIQKWRRLSPSGGIFALARPSSSHQSHDILILSFRHHLKCNGFAKH